MYFALFVCFGSSRGPEEILVLRWIFQPLLLSVLVACLTSNGDFPIHSLHKGYTRFDPNLQFWKNSNFTFYTFHACGQIDTKKSGSSTQDQQLSTARKNDGSLQRAGRASVQRLSVDWIPSWHRLWMEKPHQVAHFHQFYKQDVLFHFLVCSQFVRPRKI